MTDDTAQRGYPRPHQDNNAADDAMRLRAALDMIDADVASGLASATETAAGRVMLATIAEVVAGGAIAKASTPAGVQAAIAAAIDGLIGAAPAALDTLNELAAALGNDPNLAATLTAAIAAKQPAHGNLTTLSGLANVANLAAMAGLAGTADKAAYFTTAGALALMTVTAKARSLLASADEAAMRSALGLGSAATIDLSAIATVPVGTTIWTNGNVAPPGYVKENGALLSRTTYAALWAYAQGSGRVVTEAQWSAGNSGAFSTGDGSTTFRIPDSRGEFVRGWDDGRGVDGGRALGSNQSDQMQALSGTFDLGWGNNGARLSGGTAAGAFSVNRVSGTQIVQSVAWNASSYTSSVDFNSANSAGARVGTETRPRNITKLACIKY